MCYMPNTVSESVYTGHRRRADPRPHRTRQPAPHVRRTWCAVTRVVRAYRYDASKAPTEMHMR